MLDMIKFSVLIGIVVVDIIDFDGNVMVVGIELMLVYL